MKGRYRDIEGVFNGGNQMRFGVGLTADQLTHVKTWAKEHDITITSAIARLAMMALGVLPEPPQRTEKGLSPQEAEIAALAKHGIRPCDIAERLNRTPNHIAVVMNRLRARGDLPPVPRRAPVARLVSERPEKKPTPEPMAASPTRSEPYDPLKNPRMQRLLGDSR